MRHNALPEDRKEDPSAMTENDEDPAQMDEIRKQHSVENRMKKVNDPNEDGFFNAWSKIRHYLREPMAEWLGTTMAMIIGLCATLSNLTSSGQAGSYPAQSMAWGFGFMTAIYTTGGMSGGHLNPAISISLSVFRGFPARRCMKYIAAQLLGTLTAGGIPYAIYHDAIWRSRQTSQSIPRCKRRRSSSHHLAKITCASCVFHRVFGSAILVGSILALGDDTNPPPPHKNFGPRLVAVVVGWSSHLFRERHAWWIWGPWVADITGALFGALIDDMAIFTGGESPVNYPPRRRKRAYRMRALNLRKKLRIGRKKIPDLERSVAEAEH
ncbi:Aquaglyceroporin, putative [Penicillium digitatum Pd1]|uniref:Aquaglyceroporin, putative n=1 Tax=Penicillium digitatum (strain Pd1 / CECT 20795) TaxID=1170230 RepID=K9G4A0_PEND1|nr:Aquaglyceroporin, putative [Penicillium digitatum Pd1]EKV09673.1 Aquaglyceroporin, putative [Penicillium digitatum Pd1]